MPWRTASAEFQGRKWLRPSSSRVFTQRAPLSRACRNPTFATGTRSSSVPCTMITGAPMSGSSAASASSSGLRPISSAFALRIARGSSQRTRPGTHPLQRVDGLQRRVERRGEQYQRGHAQRMLGGDAGHDRSAERMAEQHDTPPVGREQGDHRRGLLAQAWPGPDGALRPKPGRSSATTSMPGGASSRRRPNRQPNPACRAPGSAAGRSVPRR